MLVRIKNICSMKKRLFYLLVLLLILSCKSYLYNVALDSLGVYDDEINLSSIHSVKRDVVFFPMRHIGTELYYADIKSKVDSLKSQGYYFYLEQVLGDKEKDSTQRKFKKLIGLPNTKEGYTENIDSILGKKFKGKKEIVNQPSYKDLGVDSTLSKRVDVDVKYIIDFYEKNYKEIILEPCDFETTLYEVTVCDDKDYKMTKEVREDVITNSRNLVVINQILADTILPKIAVIYGENHIKGIKEGLLKEGYTEN